MQQKKEPAAEGRSGEEACGKKVKRGEWEGEKAGRSAMECWYH